MAEKILIALTAELRRQADAYGSTPYVDEENPRDAILDGHFNLVELAEAIAKAV